ncbi:MAG TPA: hypothetical protein VFW73_11885 [Lacipirellulaceae bacterium]|nr:hypothetical protein [Lacipirellulaceae bacterium]
MMNMKMFRAATFFVLKCSPPQYFEIFGVNVLRRSQHRSTMSTEKRLQNPVSCEYHSKHSVALAQNAALEAGPHWALAPGERSLCHERTTMRRLRFSLRTLIMVITALSCMLGLVFWYLERECRLARLESDATEQLFRAFDDAPPEVESGQVVPWASSAAQNTAAKELYNYWEVEGKSTIDFSLGNYQADYWRTRLADRQKATGEIVRLLLDHFAEAVRPLGTDTTQTKRTKLSRGTRTEMKLLIGGRNLEADITIIDGPNNFFFVAGQTGRH